MIKCKRTRLAGIWLQLVFVAVSLGEITHAVRPGVGVFPEPEHRLIVSETIDGYLVEFNFEKNGGGTPLFVGSWRSDRWTRFYADEVSWEGSAQAPVEFSFNSFSDGPVAIQTDGEFRLPPNDAEGYSVSSESAGCLRCAPARVVFEYSVTELDPPLPSDFDFNDKVDFSDFLILSSNFGHLNRSWKDGDATLNGLVDFEDFLILADNFGTTRDPQLAAVPEPAAFTTALGTCFGFVVLGRRRRGGPEGDRPRCHQ